MSLYARVYDDLTAAVKRAKQACTKKSLKSLKAANTSESVGPMNQKPQRGRPKGSKDTLPRKRKEPLKLPTIISVTSVSVHTWCPLQNQGMGLYQPLQAGTADLTTSTVDHAYPCAEMDRGGNDAMTHHETQSILFLRYGYPSDSPSDMSDGPPCWKLPIPC
jgi:hypothetical protein